MKPIKLVAFAICLCLVGLFGYLTFNSSGSAQKVARNQWEYAAIVSAYAFSPYRDKLNKIYGMAEICYLQNSGCRRLEIKHELDYGLFLQDRIWPENFESRQRASLKASEIAFQKALVQLGNEGWEIVSEPNLNFEFVNIDDYNKYEDKSLLFLRENTKAVYFKRLKTP